MDMLFPNSICNSVSNPVQVMAQLVSRTLHAAFTAWLEFAHRSAEKDAMMRLAAGRLHNVTLAKVWQFELPPHGT